MAYIVNSIWYKELRAKYNNILIDHFNKTIYNYLICYNKLTIIEQNNVWSFLQYLSMEAFIQLEKDLQIWFPRNEACVCWLINHKQFKAAKFIMENNTQELILFTPAIFLTALKNSATIDFINWMLENDSFGLYSPLSPIDHNLVIKLATLYCNNDVFMSLIYRGYNIDYIVKDSL
jgi:hypothetical protein